MVVLGRGSRVALEGGVSPPASRDGVALRRRRGGGCAVVLDPGDVVVAVALPVGGFRRQPAPPAALSAWLIDGLERTGVAGVCRTGAAISRSAIARSAARAAAHATAMFYSASILVEPRLDLIARYLRHPPARARTIDAAGPHADFNRRAGGAARRIGGRPRRWPDAGAEQTRGPEQRVEDLIISLGASTGSSRTSRSPWCSAPAGRCRRSPPPPTGLGSRCRRRRSRG